MPKPGRILLVEDDPNDAELTLSALEENGVANEIFVVTDGEEALDHLFRRGTYASREEGNPIASADGWTGLLLPRRAERHPPVPVRPSPS
jgi:CheY-like chemotaxis protein